MLNFIRQYMSEVSVWHLLLFTLIGTLIATILLLLPPVYPILMLAGIIGFALVAKRPEIGILIIVVLTSSIVFEDSLPLVPIGIGSFHVSDVILLFMLGITGYKRLFNDGFTLASSPLNRPLLIFIAFAFISAFLAVTRFGVNFNDAARLLRVISYYILIFLILNLVKEKQQIAFLIKGLFVIATIVALAMVAQAIVGEARVLMPGRVESAASIGREFGTLRILPPGQTLVFVMFITSTCSLVFLREKPIPISPHFWLILILGAGIVLTYNRSYWIAVILGAAILMMISARENRTRLWGVLVMVLVLGGSLFFTFSGSGGKLGATADAVSERFTSLFAGSELTRSGPVDHRRIENSYAIEQIKNHPLLGIGLHNDYRPKIYGRDDNLSHYVHNAYLWLLADMGIIGFLSFFWFYTLFLVRAFRNWKRIPDNLLKAAVAGFMISGVVMLSMALVIPIFLEWFSITVLAVMIGLTEAITRFTEAGESS